MSDNEISTIGAPIFRLQSESLPLMTVEDVSIRLKASESFVYDAIASGRLKHYRLGKGQGGIRVSEAQLADFLADAERGGQSAETTKPSAQRRAVFQHLPPPS